MYIFLVGFTVLLSLSYLNDVPGKVVTIRCALSSLYVCMVNIKLKYIFVETPRKFIVAELSIRKLGSSSVLIIMHNNSG